MPERIDNFLCVQECKFGTFSESCSVKRFSVKQGKNKNGKKNIRWRTVKCPVPVLPGHEKVH